MFTSIYTFYPKMIKPDLSLLCQCIYLKKNWMKGSECFLNAHMNYNTLQECHCQRNVWFAGFRHRHTITSWPSSQPCAWTESSNEKASRLDMVPNGTETQPNLRRGTSLRRKISISENKWQYVPHYCENIYCIGTNFIITVFIWQTFITYIRFSL